MRFTLPILALMACCSAVRADELVFTDSFEPPSTDCDLSEEADVPGFTRQCAGTIDYPFGAPSYGGPFTQYEQIEGLWPGSPTYLGQAAVFYLGKTQFVSFAFQPDTPHAVKWSGNASYGGGGWISISQSPGLFATALCSQASGASNNFIFASNGYAGAQLKCRHLNPDLTYYLNIVNANSLGAALCGANKCPMAYTPLKIQ